MEITMQMKMEKVMKGENVQTESSAKAKQGIKRKKLLIVLHNECECRGTQTESNTNTLNGWGNQEVNFNFHPSQANLLHWKISLKWFTQNTCYSIKAFHDKTSFSTTTFSSNQFLTCFFFITCRKWDYKGPKKGSKKRQFHRGICRGIQTKRSKAFINYSVQPTSLAIKRWINSIKIPSKHHNSN